MSGITEHNIDWSDALPFSNISGYHEKLTKIDIRGVKAYVMEKYNIYPDMDISNNICYPYPNFEEMSHILNIPNHEVLVSESNKSTPDGKVRKFTISGLEQFNLGQGEFSIYFDSSDSPSLRRYVAMAKARAQLIYAPDASYAFGYLDDDLKETEFSFHFSFRVILEILVRKEIMDFLIELGYDREVDFTRENEIYVDHIEYDKVNFKEVPFCFAFYKKQFDGIVLGNSLALFSCDNQVNYLTYNHDSAFYYDNLFEERILVFLRDYFKSKSTDNLVQKYIEKIRELLSEGDIKLYDIFINFDDSTSVKCIDMLLSQKLESHQIKKDEKLNRYRVWKTKRGFVSSLLNLKIEDIDVSFYTSRTDLFFKQDKNAYNLIKEQFRQDRIPNNQSSSTPEPLSFTKAVQMINQGLPLPVFKPGDFSQFPRQPVQIPGSQFPTQPVQFPCFGPGSAKEPTEDMKNTSNN